MDLLSKSDEEIFEIGKPFWENLIRSSNLKDYGGFTKDFSTQMLFGANEVELGKQWASNKLIVNNRCLVPFNYYFEWISTDTLKQKYKLYTDSQVGFFAALFSLVDNTYYFSILTKSSLESIKFIHKRNPVIINKSKIKQWFSSNYESLLGSSEDINYELLK